MPSSYTSNLGIEKPADGELDGVWGDVVNDNMEILDRATNGSVTLSLSGTSSTLTTTDGALSNGQYALLILAGSPSGTHTITIAPNDAQKIYFVRNTTAQSVVFTQGSGGNVTIAAGDSATIYANGGGSGAEVGFALSPVTLASLGVTASATELNYVDGVTSAIQTQLDSKQATDPTLTALAAYNTNGILTQTSENTFAGRSIAAGTGISVTDGDGVSGNPTIAADLASQAEAEAGTDNTHVMTPLRTAQAIDANWFEYNPFSNTWSLALLTSSTTYTIPSGKRYEIWACGGGGSGSVQNTGSTTSDTKSLGGNGGSVVVQRGTAASELTLTVTIGAGGAARTSGNQNGLDGGATTVTGTGTDITAAGGAGGIYTSTGAIASASNGASSGGTVYLPGLWNVGAHSDGNISFSGTAPFGGGGTTPGITTSGMSSANDSFNSQDIGLTMNSYNNFNFDTKKVPYVLIAQKYFAEALYFGAIYAPIYDTMRGGAAGDASSDTDALAGAYGAGGGGASDSTGMVSGAGGAGWVIIVVEV